MPATFVTYALEKRTGISRPLPMWASRSRRWLEWAANGANRSADAETYHWWVGRVPYPMPVTAYPWEGDE